MVELDIAISWFHPSVGGVEQRAFEIAARLAKRGHSIVVHTTAAKPDRTPLPAGPEKMQGFEVVRYVPEVFRGSFRLYYEPAIRDASVLECHGYPNLITDRLVSSQAGSRGITIAPHGLTLRPRALRHRILRAAYDRWKGFATLRRADVIQAMTPDEERWLRDRAISTRVEVVPSGIEDAAFRAYDTKPVGSRLGLSRYIVFVGRLFSEKNPRHLVQAFARVAPGDPELKLCLVGPDQGEASPVRSLAASLGISDRVVLAGPVSTEEKFALIRGSLFLALPSDFEAQGLVLLEAMAQGRTVLASRVGGVPHVVRDSETGLLHERGDVEGIENGMRRLLRDHGLRYRLEKNAIAESQRYRWERVVPQLEAIYEELASAPRQP